MTGKIESGQLCTVEPVEEDDLKKGDVVLCKVNGNQYLHLIKAIQGKRYQIGNNRGGINWLDHIQLNLRQTRKCRNLRESLIHARIESTAFVLRFAGPSWSLTSIPLSIVL
ncbi:hypothetical protein [uncultured Gimesia sp.]|uniref:hypothetical protein n=1 Tax=uncultured Gimesia sp. TaxID=1678688 RepID=UPI003456667F